MSAAILTSDLMFASKAAQSGSRQGIGVATLLGASALRELAGRQAVGWLAVDLATLPVDPRTLVPELRGLLAPGARIVAFGPHVQEAKLAAAREAGCDLVLSRGQFDAQLDALLREYAAAEA